MDWLKSWVWDPNVDEENKVEKENKMDVENKIEEENKKDTENETTKDNIAENKDESLLQIRAVTRFVVLPKDSSKWKNIIEEAAKFDATVASALTSQGGYEVQTLRIVTNPFGEYLDITSEESALKDMALLKSILTGPDMPSVRIRFAIGAAVNKDELTLVPILIQNYGDLANVCININVNDLGVPDKDMCTAAAQCVRQLAEKTPQGEGNFNFTANFNCKPLIPYFPAGYNTNKNVFCIGVEYPNLLVSVLKQQSTPVDWDKAFVAMQNAVQQHIDTITEIATKCSQESGLPYAGLDSSPAPRKAIHSMVEVFKLLGVDFGGPGTLKCCSYLTYLFKSVKGVPLIGFSGLMLTCLEDAGMAEAAANHAYNITMLNAYSAVCGIGLDCVPIPGDTTSEQISTLMADTGTLAFRLDKPLTVRLFPCPGLKAGDMTKFTSPDLCNCTVFSV